MVTAETEVFVLGADGAELLHTVLAPGAYIIGRTEECDLRVDADLVSRKHARLIITEDSVAIEDLGSSNGTFVNGQAVTDSARLWPNQRIQIGAATLSVRRRKLPGDSERPANAAAVRRLLPEEILRDRKYDIGREVAKGGMGAILSAQEGAIRREVAMKVMLGAGAEDDLLRFVEEAQITGQLEHPNIVPVHELGVDENDQLFYTMKMVRGITLKKVLELLAQGVPATVQKYPLSALLTIFQKVCDAIAFAHAKGVLHRDLKPENIMIGGYGEVLVMDWGLAKIIGAVQAASEGAAVKSVMLSARRDADVGGMTMAGTIMGTPQYMSPEQARGEVEFLEATSDIYSLGAILFQMLALRSPVTGRTALEIVNKVGSGDVEKLEPAAALRSGVKAVLPHLPGGLVPDSLAAVVRKAMAFDPAARYQNVSALQADIAAFQGGFATSAEHAGAWKQLKLLVARNRGVSIAIAAALALLAVLGGVHTVHLERERQRAEAQKKRALVGEKRAEEALATANAALVRVKYEKAREAFDNNRAEEGILWLAAALRADPAHPTAGSWLISALTERNFVLPAAPRIDLESNGPDSFNRPDEFSALHFLPDSKRLLLCARLSGVNQWDAETSQRGWHWADKTADIKRLTLSPDGREWAAVYYGGKMARIFDSETGAALSRTADHEGDVHQVVFTPDGRTLLSADSKTVYFWDASSGAASGERIPMSAYPESLQVSADGRWLAVRLGGPAGETQVFDLRTRQLAHPPILKMNGLPRFHPSLGSQLLLPAGPGVNRAWIFDVATGAVIDTDEGHSNSTNAAQFSPIGGRFVTSNTGGDFRVRIWETRTGAPRTPWLKHGGSVNAAHFSPEGLRLFTAGNENVCRLWSARTGEPLAEPWRLPDGPFRGDLARWSPDGTRLAVPNRKHSVQLYDVRDGRQMPQVVRTVTGYCDQLFFAPDGKWFVVGGITGARRYDARTLDQLGPELKHAKRITGLAISADGARIVTGAEDGMARIWDAATGKPLTPELPHDGRTVQSLALDPAAQLLATFCSDQLVRLWDIATGKTIGAEMKLSTQGARRLAFSPDGATLAVASDHQTFLFDARTQQRRLKIGREGSHYDARFSPDGRLLAVATDREGVWVFDTTTWQEAYPALNHSAVARSVRFSPDGARLLTAGDEAVARLWDARTGELLSVLPHPEPVRFAFFSPDGARVATVAFDFAVRLWDTATGQPLSVALTHTEVPTTANFSPDGARIFTTHGNGFLNVWDVPPMPTPAPEWLPALAETVAGRRLNERGDFVPVGEREFWNLRAQIRTAGGQDHFARWAHWFFADRATRPVSPWSVATAREVLGRWTAVPQIAHYEQALRRLIGDSETPARLAHALLGNVKTVPFAESDAEYLLAAATRMKLEKHLAAKRAEGAPLYTSNVGERGFPARDPAATAQQLDLTRHYTALLDLPLHSDDARYQLGKLPMGLQEFGGVRFDVRGVVHLWGRRNYSSKPHPLRIEGIPVEQKVKRLHFLHTSAHGAPAGTKIATYVWHYADGTEHHTPVVYGEDLSNWGDATPASRAREVWNTMNSDARVRLFLRSFDNPHPDTPVATLELLSAREEAPAIVVAISVE